MDLVSTIEEAEEIIFAKWFRSEREIEGFDKLEEAHRIFVSPEEMQKVLQLEFPRRFKAQTDFRKWLERTYGVRRKQVRLVNDERPWRYVGIVMKKRVEKSDSATFRDVGHD